MLKFNCYFYVWALLLNPDSKTMWFLETMCHMGHLFSMPSLAVSEGTQILPKPATTNHHVKPKKQKGYVHVSILKEWKNMGTNWKGFSKQNQVFNGSEPIFILI